MNGLLEFIKLLVESITLFFVNVFPALLNLPSLSDIVASIFGISTLTIEIILFVLKWFCS